nr:hypothetical protein [Microbacterium sp.]
MGSLAGLDRGPVGEDDIRGEDAVDGQTMLAHHPSDSTAGGDSPDPHRASVPGRERKTFWPESVGDIAPRRSSTEPNPTRTGVDHDDVGHRPQVDNHSPVVRAPALTAVAAAAHR